VTPTERGRTRSRAAPIAAATALPGFDIRVRERAETGPLRSSEVSLVRRADRLCIARNGPASSPTLGHFTGRPGMVRTLDRSTVALAVHDRTAGVAGRSTDESGDGYCGLIIADHEMRALLVWGAVRWLPCRAAGDDLRAAFAIDCGRQDTLQLLVFEIEFFRVVASSNDEAVAE